MKRILFLLAFVPFIVSGQLPDSADIRMRYFGIPSVNPDPDFIRTQTGRLNARDVYVNSRADSLKDGTGFITVDSIVTGALRFSNTVWDDLKVPLTNTKLTPTKSEPGYEEIADGIYTFVFDADADSSEALHFVAQIQHGYSLGDSIEAHIHWSPATTNTGNVKWKFRWRMGAINDTIMAIDSLVVVDAADGIVMKHQLTELGWIQGDSLGISALIIGSIARMGEDAADTFTGAAYGWELDFHVPMSDIGSPEDDYKAQ
jgi:hypothetical protein